jgi:surface carbohydrate biosynthesis protein
MKKIKKFLYAKWDLLPPKKKKILVFDGNNNPFINYILKSGYNTLYLRWERINLFILIKCLIKNKLNVDQYISEYIRFSSPKLILTFIDNNPKFYTLYRHGNFKTIFVQSGIRSRASDIFSNKKIINKKNKKKFKVDYMFVFNSKIGLLYNSFIKGSSIPIGSFKNNNIKIQKNKKQNKILIISTFRNYSKKQSIGKNLMWGTFTKNDEYFMRWIILLAMKNNIKIDVLGRYSLKETNEEFTYFKNFFKKNKFNYIDNYSKRETYKILDSYKFAFTIDSTLGVECLARGGRIGFFCNRPNKMPEKSRKFGWMENFNSTGPFWTYKNSQAEIKKIFNKVVFSKNAEWNKISKKYKNKIMNYDYNNKKFKLVLKKII